jgi:hypothetical protein
MLRQEKKRRRSGKMTRKVKKSPKKRRRRGKMTRKVKKSPKKGRKRGKLTRKMKKIPKKKSLLNTIKSNDIRRQIVKTFFMVLFFQ